MVSAIDAAGDAMALTKNTIVTRIHELGFTKKKSVEIIETLLEIIKRTLEKGDDVLISGFGKFCVKEKKRRRGRNPATGEDLLLKELDGWTLPEWLRDSLAKATFTPRTKVRSDAW